MANGAPAPNGRRDPRVEHALAEAEAIEQAKRQAVALMRQAIINPDQSLRYHANLVAVAHEDGQPVLLVGLPNGQRLEFPITDVAAQRVGEGLLEGPGDEPGSEQSEATSEGGVILGANGAGIAHG